MKSGRVEPSTATHDSQLCIQNVMKKDRRTAPQRWFAAASATLLLATGACSDRSSPLDPLPPELTAPQAEVDAFAPSIDDAAERVVPVIADETLGGNLVEDLSALKAALERGDAREGRARVISAQERLDRYSARPEAQGDGPDLSVIELVLDRARQLLEMDEAL